MRAEVGLLSRNVVIRGEMESSCYPPNPCEEVTYDTFGGHIIAKYDCKQYSSIICHLQRKDFSTFRVEHAELRQMGQLGIIGRSQKLNLNRALTSLWDVDEFSKVKVPTSLAHGRPAGCWGQLCGQQLNSRHHAGH